MVVQSLVFGLVNYGGETDLNGYLFLEQEALYFWATPPEMSILLTPYFRLYPTLREVVVIVNRNKGMRHTNQSWMQRRG